MSEPYRVVNQTTGEVLEHDGRQWVKAGPQQVSAASNPPMSVQLDPMGSPVEMLAEAPQRDVVRNPKTGEEMEFDGKKWVPKVSDAEGVVRSIGQGVSLGFGDEYIASTQRRVAEEGLAKTVATSLFPPVALGRVAYDMATRPEGYTSRLKQNEDRRTAFADRNPVEAGALEIAGTLPWMFTPLGGARYVAAARTPLQMAGRSALAAGGMSAVQGFGAGGDAEGTAGEDLASRAASAATHGIAGTVFGGALGYGAARVGRALAPALQATDEMATPRTAADNVLMRTLARDRVRPGELAARIEADYPSITAYDAGRRVRVPVDTTNEAPMSLVDQVMRFSGKPGGGESTLWKMKGISSMPGEARSTISEAMTPRQLESADRIATAIETHIAPGRVKGSLAPGGIDTSLTPETRLDKLRQLEKAYYYIAEQIQKPVDVSAEVASIRAASQGRAGDIGKSMQRVADLFEPQGRPIATLRQWQNAKLELDQLIESSKGITGPTPLTRELTQIKQTMMDRVGAQNPAWKEANDLFADGRLAERMLEMGQEASLKFGGKTREIMAEWQKLSNPQAIRQLRSSAHMPKEGQDAIIALRQEMFREGLARGMLDRVMNAKPGHDVASQFTTPASRQILEVVLGPQRAAAFFRAVDKEVQATRSYRALGGSQTAGLKAEQDDLGLPGQVATAWSVGLNPKKMVELAAQRIGARLTEAQNAEVARVLVNMNPREQVAFLRRLEGTMAARERGQGALAQNVPAFSVPAINPLAADRRRDNPLTRR